MADGNLTKGPFFLRPIDFLLENINILKAGLSFSGSTLFSPDRSHTFLSRLGPHSLGVEGYTIKLE